MGIALVPRMAFDVLRLAVEAVKALREPVNRIEQRDRDLGRQIRRAATGVVLQISEGRKRIGRDRLHLFRVAAGSASEAWDALEVAEAWGYVEAESLDPARGRLDRVRAMLWRLTHPRSKP